MDKESVYLLQNIDCNCNDCKFMVRDFDALEQSKQKHNEWQYLSFFNTRTKFIRESLDYRIRAEKEKDIEKKKELFKKGYNILKMAKAMKYSFSNDSKIAFGNCSKFNKPITFIPETCQLDTQNCFEHRKNPL